MNKSRVETWRDVATGDLCFTGRLSMWDYPMRLDEIERLTIEQASDCGSPADVLLALEILFRRGAEQHYAGRARTIGPGKCIGHSMIAAPAAPQPLPRPVAQPITPAQALAQLVQSLKRAFWRK